MREKNINKLTLTPKRRKVFLFAYCNIMQVKTTLGKTTTKLPQMTFKKIE